jgi:uncharacterized protein YggE
MRPIRLLALASLAVVPALVVAAAGPERASGLAEQLRAEGITVGGTGIVRSVPDRADLSFGVLSQGRTATQALAANSTEMRRVIAAIREAGIAAADVQTQQVAIYPRFSESGEEILGYTAQNSVTARVRNLDRAGAIIDAAVVAGANQVSGPTLSRTDQSELYRNALRAGVADARTKAQAIAAAAGVTLGQVVGVQETGAESPPSPADARAAGQEAAPIEPGTQEIQASVTVTFAVA